MRERKIVDEELSIKTYREFREAIVFDICQSDFQYEELDTVAISAILYAALNAEIAQALYRPIEEIGFVDKHLKEVARWGRAVEFANMGHWGVMIEEIQADAEKFTNEAQNSEDVQFGHSLQSLADRLQGP